MTCARFCGMLLTLLVVATVPAYCSASTNAMSGSASSSVSGYNDFNVWVTDVGNGVAAIYQKTFEYPSYSSGSMYQFVFGFSYDYSPAIRSTYNYIDDDGNEYRESWWGDLSDPWPGTINVGVYNMINTCSIDLEANLHGLYSSTPFPVPSGSIPPEVQRYLQAGPFTQSDEPEIVLHAWELTQGCVYEYGAVCRIVDWCMDNLTYDTTQPIDALSILRDPQHRAQCAGYSHLAIALLKSMGIPARYVGGFVMGYPYADAFECPGDGVTYWISHGNAPHAWIEVYYPDEGWRPYDAQLYYHFVDTHGFKRCVGIDTHERYPWVVEIYGWPPYGTVSAWVTLSSSVLYETNTLEYYGTLSTPLSQAQGDWVGGIAGTEYTAGEPRLWVPLVCCPNPFGGETLLKYSVEEPTLAIVSIYSVTGQLVWRKQKMSTAGIETVRWSGVGSLGRRLPAGIYFCVLDLGERQERAKMVMLK